jgi:hypothetical protein
VARRSPVVDFTRFCAFFVLPGGNFGFAAQPILCRTSGFLVLVSLIKMVQHHVTKGND